MLSTVALLSLGLIGGGFAWGVCAWCHLHRQRLLVEGLRALAGGQVPPEDMLEKLGEAGALLRKAAHRQEETAREARDARFDLHAILAGLDDGVLVADHLGIITLVNPSLRQIFSLKASPVGQSVLTTLRQPILQTMLEGVLQEGASQQAEVDLPGRSPTTHLVVSAAPLRDATGQPGAVVVVRDVSRLRRLEEVRRDFVANVSHELRTPLSIFQGYLENLLENEQQETATVQNSLRIMRKHSLRLNALVEDLLTLARLESGRDPLQLESLAVPEFLQEVQRDWQGKATARGVEVALQMETDLPQLTVDTLRLHQVLNNLLDNALKYSPHGGAILLQAGRGAGDEPEGATWVDLSVQDSGPGISREDLPHIFQRFYRADKARSRELGGTGLGLAIVKHIAQAHGGTAHAESEPGRGTKVTVRLPVQG